MLLAASYIFGFALFIGVTDRSGYSGPAGDLAFISDHQGVLTLAFALLYVLGAVVLSVLVIALHQMVLNDPGTPAKLQMPVHISAVLGILWAAMLLASGFIGIVGMAAVIPMAEDSPTTAASVWATISIVQNALGGGTEFIGGIWLVSVSAIAMLSGHISRLLGWLGLLTGAVGCATLVPQLQDLVSVYGIGQLIWFAWLGIALWRSLPHTK